MPDSEWIDDELSKELPVLRDCGEGQRVEFKEKYPSNGSDLSKEIAAFASSNTGKILIGVVDDGQLVGLDELNSSTGRDKLCRRIEGLCTNNVKPAITPVIKFAQEDGKNVLVIEVPRGQQPIYYSGDKPYIRHLSQSRPAEPHEVIERIIGWLKSSPFAPSGEGSSEDGTRGEFLSTLASALIEVLIFGDELKWRNVNPWLGELRLQLGDAGRTLRELAAEDVALEMNLDEQLRVIADSLDQAESHHLVIGRDSWANLEQYIAVSVQRASELKAEQIDIIPLSEDSESQLQDLIHRKSGQLDDLDQRAEQMVNDGRIEEVQSEASEIGHALLRMIHYYPEGMADGFVEELGRDLHLMETVRRRMDGGKSMQRILEKIHELNGRFQDFITTT